MESFYFRFIGSFSSAQKSLCVKIFMIIFQTWSIVSTVTKSEQRHAVIAHNSYGTKRLYCSYLFHIRTFEL